MVRQIKGLEIVLANKVDRNVLRWFGHLDRMDNETLLKRVLSTKVVYKYARGRPKLGWMGGVKRTLRERGINVTEAKEHARNRNE